MDIKFHLVQLWKERLEAEGLGEDREVIEEDVAIL